MILTGKAKEDFLNEHGHKEHEIDDLYLYALIIEWFDSVGIYVNAISFEKGKIWKSICNNQMLKNKFSSRREALQKAIIKANKIYNSK